MEKKNLLVLDNTTSIVSPWKGELKKYFNLIEAVGGFEAISKLRENRFSAAIINISIRSFDGIDALRKIREKEPQLPVVIIAEKSDARFVKDAANYGIHGYFFIPVEPVEILSLLVKLSGVDLNSFVKGEEETKLTENNKSAEEEKEEKKDVPALYYEAQSFLARGEIDKAIETFNNILNVKKLKDIWLKYVEESYFQLARCYMKLDDYKKALEYFAQFIQRAPNNQYNKMAYLLSAECYEKLNNDSKAIEIYKKLVNMPPFDSVSTQARKRLKKFGIEI